MLDLPFPDSDNDVAFLRSYELDPLGPNSSERTCQCYDLFYSLTTPHHTIWPCEQWYGYPEDVPYIPCYLSASICHGYPTVLQHSPCCLAANYQFELIQCQTRTWSRILTDLASVGNSQTRFPITSYQTLKRREAQRWEVSRTANSLTLQSNQPLGPSFPQRECKIILVSNLLLLLIT